LFNLVSNAIRHSAPGTIAVSLTSDGGSLVIDVADDGGGGTTPPSTAVPFAPPASDANAGLGIGLWISHKLAEALGGRLALSVRPTGGTLARLELPLDPAARPKGKPKRRRGALTSKSVAAGRAASPSPTAPAKPAEPPKSARIVPAAPPPTPDWPLARLTVLVVDDSAVSRMLMSAVLASFDMAVTSVTNGRDAEIAVATRRPDVLIVDWSLAGETGADVIERLAKSLGDAMPPVVLASAEARPSVVAGVVAHVRKPFSPRELFNALTFAVSPGAEAATAR
ncbi:MAG TPA: response regulator, partial [Methylomirabilota bacterium]|nr:response regulator [Methylomirabilota bacterium]